MDGESMNRSCRCEEEHSDDEAISRLRGDCFGLRPRNDI